MLKELRIKNLAIIDDLKVRFEKGLNVLTGETGAGKSIIVDSLSLALGSRAQTELIRSGEEEAFVQSYFEIGENQEIPEIGIDMVEGLIIRRSISAKGKSRAYINDTMVSLHSLSEAGKSLVDIHGQHEHQSILSVDKHRILLDSYGKLHEDRVKVTNLYKEVNTLKKEEGELREKIKERVQRIDLLKFQIQEIDVASLKIGEEERLCEEKTILSNVTRLHELAETAYALLYSSEGSCVEKLSTSISKIKEISSLDSSVSETLTMLESTLPSIEESAYSLRGYKDKHDLEPQRLVEIEDRLDYIKRLEKKYGKRIEDIIRYRDKAEKELKSLELVDEKFSSIEAERKAKEELLFQSAQSLSEKRKKIAHTVEELVKSELKELAFENAEFIIEIIQGSISSHGLDRVEFLFSANPGELPKSLVKIASGGELSRVMLALKYILADFDSIPVLIFDEVDTGIGGKTAERVGEKLKKISNKHQVLCTTHLPQIASKGDFHLKIEKSQKNQRVSVKIKELTGIERLHEIARMLSGKVTEVSLTHARELLEDAA